MALVPRHTAAHTSRLAHSLFSNREEAVPSSRRQIKGALQAPGAHRSFSLHRAGVRTPFLQLPHRPHSFVFLFNLMTVNTVLADPASPHWIRQNVTQNRNFYSKQSHLVTSMVLLRVPSTPGAEGQLETCASRLWNPPNRPRAGHTELPSFPRSLGCFHLFLKLENKRTSFTSLSLHQWCPRLFLSFEIHDHGHLGRLTCPPERTPTATGIGTALTT